MLMVDLTPNMGQKSFYGKAKLFAFGDTRTLYSYNTAICEIDLKNNTFTKYWDGWTATTQRHINCFMHTVAKKDYGCGKKVWQSIPLNEPIPLEKVGEIK